MSLPAMDEGLTWKVYEWNSEKFIGIVPDEGYEWSGNIGLPAEVSAYSKKLKSLTEKAVIKAANDLHDVVFGGTYVHPPRVRPIPEEVDEVDEE